MAQAWLLPLKLGLSFDDTSVAVGLSKSWTLRLRTRFGRIQSGQEQPKTKKGLRNRARMTLEEEAAILAPYLEQAKAGGVMVVPPLNAKLAHAGGRALALSTVYAMLHRHGWRKLAPDTQHPPSDGVLDTLILPSVKGDCMQIFVDEIGARHGEEHVLMVVDGAGWHCNQELGSSRNLPRLVLPPYAPELNPVEHLWDDGREKAFYNRVLDSLESWTHISNRRLPTSRSPPNRTRGITEWPWIMNALSN